MDELNFKLSKDISKDISWAIIGHQKLPEGAELQERGLFQMGSEPRALLGLRNCISGKSR